MIAPAPPPALLAPAPDEQAALAQAARAGALLFRLDRAAWVATDAIAPKMAELAALGARGFVVMPYPDRDEVVFFGGTGIPRALFRVPVTDGKAGTPVRTADGPAGALSPVEARMVAARGTLPEQARLCGKPPANTVVFPPADAAARVTVYLLTPQQGPTAYPIGGHTRRQVGADGSVSGVRTFARSCLTLDPTQGLPEGAKPQAMVVSHLLDPVPTEIHVFTSLAADLPLVVNTVSPMRRLWLVQGTRISRLPDTARK